MLDDQEAAQRAADEGLAALDVDLIGVLKHDRSGYAVMVGAAGAIGDVFPGMRFGVDKGRGFAGTITERQIPLLFRADRTDVGIVTFESDGGSLQETVLDTRYAEHMAYRLGQESVVACIGVPIGLAGQVYGVLYAATRQATGATALHRTMTSRYARMVAPLLLSADASRRAVLEEMARERARLSAELHDWIGQSLFSIGLAARQGRSALNGLPGIVDERLSLIEDEADAAAHRLRAILGDLERLDAETDLVGQMRLLCGVFTRRSGVTSEVIVTGIGVDVDALRAKLLVAVVQEGLHNVEKHAGASTVIVSVHRGAETILVAVQDDGVGPTRRSKGRSTDGAGRGLASLHRRLGDQGGTLDLKRRSEGGATLSAVLPLVSG